MSRLGDLKSSIWKTTREDYFLEDLDLHHQTNKYSFTYDPKYSIPSTSIYYSYEEETESYISQPFSSTSNNDKNSDSGTLFTNKLQESFEKEEDAGSRVVDSRKNLTWTKTHSGVVVGRPGWETRQSEFLFDQVIQAMHSHLHRTRKGLSETDIDELVSEAIVYYAEKLAWEKEQQAQGLEYPELSVIGYAIDAFNRCNDAFKARNAKKRKEVDIDYTEDMEMVDPDQIVEDADLITWAASLSKTQLKAFKEFMEWNEYAGDGVITPKAMKQRLNRVPSPEVDTTVYRQPKQKQRRERKPRDLREKPYEDRPVDTKDMTEYQRLRMEVTR